MKKVVLFFALTVGLLASATLQAQNMSRYITLDVKRGEAISLDFWGAANATPIRIVNGKKTENIIVGTVWVGRKSFTTKSTTMTIYGDLKRFDCAGNGANITALDVSNSPGLETLLCQGNQISNLNVSKNNTNLSRLICHGNNLSTQAIDDIYCSLPYRTGQYSGVIEPVYNSSSADHATVLATNKTNATAKNWKVQYADGNADITTTGSYTCPQLNMSRYITLTVKSGKAIRLDLWATANLTPIRIVSGSNTKDIIVNDVWKGSAYYTADGTTMTIYGDLKKFDCGGNGAKIIALDPSHNTQLTNLDCYTNDLATLDVSQNTQLIYLNCSSDKLNSLDVSNCTQLTDLYCSSNNLRSLDVSKNTKLRKLICLGNLFTTPALDAIYCALPDRTGTTNGVIQPVKNASDPNHATVLATNKQNAIAKKWKVQYFDDKADIPSTTGSYVCSGGGSGGGSEPNMSRYITLTVGSGKAIKLNFQAAAAGTPVRIVSGSTNTIVTVGSNWTGFANYTADGTTMTVYGDLTGFDCSKNGANLIALDVSNNARLKYLYCSYNTLSSLDVSKNTLLGWLYCYGNLFTTPALDAIYCALPDRTGKNNGAIYPLENPSDPNHTTILATNAQNAIAKNWKVQYYIGDTDIATTGKHKCSATDIAEAAAEPALTLYPNPVADVFYLSATARTIRVYDIYGTEVAHATDTDRVEVSHLPAGIYTVKADGTVAKMVKR